MLTEVSGNMGTIDNTRRIIREDYDAEYHDLIDRLGFVLNTFMEQTVQQVNGNLDETNLKADIVTVKMTVNASGVPVGNNLIRSEVLRPDGTTVIKATNKADGTVFPTSRPHISFTTLHPSRCKPPVMNNQSPTTRIDRTSVGNA